MQFFKWGKHDAVYIMNKCGICMLWYNSSSLTECIHYKDYCFKVWYMDKTNWMSLVCCIFKSLDTSWQYNFPRQFAWKMEFLPSIGINTAYGAQVIWNCYPSHIHKDKTVWREISCKIIFHHPIINHPKKENELKQQIRSFFIEKTCQ